MEINNVINIIQAINKIDLNEKIYIKLNFNEEDFNNESINNKNDIDYKFSEDDLSEDYSDQYHNSEDEQLDNNEDVAENDGDKIPNLYERVLMNKNNLKYKELIKEITEKKKFKRSEMPNDNDLSNILKNKDINKKKKVKFTYPKD